MSKYLSKYPSTIPESAARKINALMSDYESKGRIISVGEREHWYKQLQDTINKYFEPTTKDISAVDGELIWSEVLNYLFSQIKFDLDTCFLEANSIFDFINLNRISTERKISDYKALASGLLSKYINMHSLRRNGSSWDNGYFVHFDSGKRLFVPYGKNIKKDMYLDFDGLPLKALDIVADTDTDSNTGKAVLSGSTVAIPFIEPELIWDEETTLPDFTLDSGTDISNSVVEDITGWTEVLCFGKPVIHNAAPTAAALKTSPMSDRFTGDILLQGFNSIGKAREYYIKFTTKGEIGSAKYICSDDGINYTDIICVQDTGIGCKYEYDYVYQSGCKNTDCIRYTQIGEVTTSASLYTSVFNSHNEDTGFAVKFVGSGSFYPGDVYKISCPCEEEYGAAIKYTARASSNTVSNWITIDPIADYPVLVDSVWYYDESEHEALLLTGNSFILDAPVRLDYSPRVVTRILLKLRQTNYTNDRYNLKESDIADSYLGQSVLEQDEDGITVDTVSTLASSIIANTSLKETLFGTKTDRVIKNDSFCYILGFLNIEMGYTEYETASRSALKALRVDNLGIIKLDTLTEESAHTSAEYDLTIKNYGSNGDWLYSMDIPIPSFNTNSDFSLINTQEQKEERLRVTDKIGKLRFYSKSISNVYSVYTNETLIEGQDFTVIQNTLTHPYATYIDLTDYIDSNPTLPGLLFTSTYTPTTEVFLDKDKTAYYNDAGYVELSLKDKRPVAVSSDVYLFITARRSNYNKGYTPKIINVHLLTSSIDPYKYYPEGDSNYQSSTVMYNNNTSVV